MDSSRKTRDLTHDGAISSALSGESILHELLGLIPALSEDEREQVLLNAIALPRAFAGRREA